MKNTFIEASAGTGKTYKIMELLGEWMEVHALEKENFLSKVLVLTFTEKAAGELKERLRKKIIDLKSVASDPNIYSRYLMELDQVTISTFHGFCNMILREYPVESNTSPDWELSDPGDRLKEILYQLKHTQWKDLNISNEALSALLIGTNFYTNYESIVLETATKLLSGRDYLLEPTKESNFNFPKEDLTFEISQLKGSVLSFSNWLLEQSQQNALLQAGKTTWTENWKSFSDFLSDDAIEDLDLFLGRFFQFLNFPFLNLEQGLNKFLPNEKYFSAKKNPETVIEIQRRGLKATEDIFIIANKIFNSIGVDSFLQKTTLYIVEKVKNKYQESKWMSYDQMIISVRDAIFTNPNLLSLLRKKYSVCLLDEFQDTDLLQYQIFKKIFLEADDQNHFLYLIGDPKQSIYSFRGGDLGTYLLAKSELSDMDTKPLTTNRRSVPQLIRGYNRIFGIGNPGSTFFPIGEIGITGNEICYTEVKAPDVTEQTINLIDPFNEGPIQVIKLSEDSENSTTSKKKSGSIEMNLERISRATATERWNQFICLEIKKLAFEQFSFVSKGNIKKMRFRDIAILVKSRKDGLSVESSLRAHDIPCTYYKQEGIYQSREIDQIQNILECLLNPNDPASYRKLLLGDLFQINPEYLKNFDEHSIDSYEKKRLDAWRKLIGSNQYAEFFRRLEEDTRIFFTKGKKDLRWERRRTNYRQILQKLLEYQITNQSNLKELLEELKKWKAEYTNEAEQPLFDRETEEDAVQILTIHASKGLEWPIVFVHGFSEMFSFPKVYDYPVSTDKGRRWNLSLWEHKLSNYNESGLNEQKRLLYVALTRPQVRLYLPYCHLTKEKSPYHQFLFTSLQSIIGDSQTKYPEDEFTVRTYHHSPGLETSKEELKTDGSLTQENNLVQFVPPTHHELDIKKRLYLHSYSSLKKGITKEFSKIEDQNLPVEPNLDLISMESLPSSSNTGLFLHNLLEEIKFQDFNGTDESIIISSETWNSILMKNMNKYGLLKDPEKIPSYKNHAFQLINNTLKSFIPLNDKVYFSLNELNENEKTEEMDFQYLLSELKIKGTLGNFLKGSIDLVFNKDNKYYIADYKSDKLINYDTASLALRIKESHYDLQRDIYAYIFFSYLKSLIGEKAALQQFGGVYYLFLRGMKPKMSEGIYADLGTGEDGKWDLDRFERIKKNIESYVYKTLDEVNL